MTSSVAKKFKEGVYKSIASEAVMNLEFCVYLRSDPKVSMFYFGACLNQPSNRIELLLTITVPISFNEYELGKGAIDFWIFFR